MNRHFVDGKERMTVYGEKTAACAVGFWRESNVNKLVWLVWSGTHGWLACLYFILCYGGGTVVPGRYFSPITSFANALGNISDWKIIKSGFAFFRTSVPIQIRKQNIWKQALKKYHQVLSEFIQREREFTGDVSHELRNATDHSKRQCAAVSGTLMATTNHLPA